MESATNCTVGSHWGAEIIAAVSAERGQRPHQLHGPAPGKTRPSASRHARMPTNAEVGHARVEDVQERLRVAGEQRQGQRQAPEANGRYLPRPGADQSIAPSKRPVQAQEDQREPDRRGKDGGLLDREGGQIASEGEGQRPHSSSQPTAGASADEEISEERAQAEVRDDLQLQPPEAQLAPPGEEHGDRADRIEGRRLAVGEPRLSPVDVRVPKGELALSHLASRPRPQRVVLLGEIPGGESGSIRQVGREIGQEEEERREGQRRDDQDLGQAASRGWIHAPPRWAVGGV